MPGAVIIAGATVVEPGPELRDVDVRIEGDIIAAVEPAGSLAGSPVDRLIDADGGFLMPGLVNAHTHSGQHLDRGVAPNLPLDLWLVWVVYGGIEFSPDDAYTLATAGALEMLATGCTTVLDHAWVGLDGFDEYADAIMQAYADVGIRAGLAPMIQDRDIFESMALGHGAPAPEPLGPPADPDQLVDAMARFVERWRGRDDRLVPMIGPSAPQRCSAELLEGLAALARSTGVPVHTHALETRDQVVATRLRYGRSMVDTLDDLGLLDGHLSLAHAVWMDADEYAAVRSAGVTLVHNPVSNLRCGSGLMPFGELADSGVHLGLGADGAASNDDQNMFGAMKLAALIHTLYGDHRDWPTTNHVWRSCLGGARALGLDAGSVEVGARADLVVLGGERHVAEDGDALVRSLVFAEHGESVRTVLVAGEVVHDAGRSTRVDAAAAGRRSRELQHRIHAAAPERAAVFERYRPVLEAMHDYAATVPVAVERRAAITPAFALTTGAPT